MSSRRGSLPDFDEEELVKLIKTSVQLDCPSKAPHSVLYKIFSYFNNYLKDKPGHFLYIRPAVIGNGRQIGVQIPAEATIIIIMVAWPDYSSESPPGSPPKPPGLRLLALENG